MSANEEYTSFGIGIFFIAVIFFFLLFFPILGYVLCQTQTAIGANIIQVVKETLTKTKTEDKN